MMRATAVGPASSTASASSSATAAASSGATPAMVASSASSQKQQQKEQQVPKQKTNLSYRPEFIEGNEAENQRTLEAYGKEVSDQIEEMQKQRENWRDVLRQLYEDDVAQDDHHRELKRRVLIGEAEALSNPTFHRWMHSREQHGVGQEKIDGWFKIDELLRFTPYVAAIPFPRTLSEKGWLEIEETIQEGFFPSSTSAAASSSSSSTSDNNQKEPAFTIEWWPLHQSEEKEQEEVKTTESENKENIEISQQQQQRRKCRRRQVNELVGCYSSPKEVRKIIESTPSLQSALVETPCLLLGDSLTTKRLHSSASASSPLVCYVVRGTLIACEPYYSSSSSSTQNNAVKFPSKLISSTESNNNNGTSLSSTSSPVLLQLREWMSKWCMECMPERSFAAAIMVHCVSPNEVAFSLLNIAPLDAVDCQYFTWTDMVGLIVSSQAARVNRPLPPRPPTPPPQNSATSEEGEEDNDNNNKSGGEAEQLEQEKKKEMLQQRQYEQQVAAENIAPKVDVVFRGPWSRFDENIKNTESSITSTPFSEIQKQQQSEEEKNKILQQKQKEEREAAEKRDKALLEAAKNSSGLSTTAVVAVAAVTCIASAAIGVTLGLKYANKQK